MKQPKTLLDAITYFSDSENCRNFMVAIRWTDGIVRCPYCGATKLTWLAKAQVYRCYGNHAKQKFSLKVGTIFVDSPLPLSKWLPAAWLISNCKNGISSYEVARALGITQKSAWHMLHRLREAMKDETGKIGGGGSVVEVDETFVGGKVKNMHKAKRVKGQSYAAGGGKTIVMGMLERGGRVRSKVIADRKIPRMAPVLENNVEKGSALITDEHTTYPFIAKEHVHEVINHFEGYVRGRVHTNGIENFWSCLKRALGGTYISVEPFHLEAYVAEQAFRYNNRKDADDFTRFATCMMGIQGKRLTYQALTERPGLV